MIFLTFQVIKSANSCAQILLEKVRKIMMNQAEVIATVPSLNERGLRYEDVKFRRVPVKFPDEGYPAFNNEFYSTWTDSYTEPSCNCPQKKGINYVKAGQLWFCANEIAIMRRLIRMDHGPEGPTTGVNPFLAVSPFMHPTDTAIDHYHQLKRQVFVTDGVHAKHLDPIYASSLLEKSARAGYIELFI